jgi:lipooligosaccharide transport system permease protein
MSWPLYGQKAAPCGLKPQGSQSRRVYSLIERNITVYKHHWPSIATGFLEPFLYLLAIGLGLGSMIGEVDGPGGRKVEYITYIAPALLASSVMNSAISESVMKVFFKLRLAKTYEAILATSIGPHDIAVAEIVWAQVRVVGYSMAFMTVMLGMGVVHSWWFVLALPASILTGLAFSSVGMATAAYMRSWVDTELVTMVVLPLFLFSTTFYPLDVLPRAVQLLVLGTPLYQSIEMLRRLALGELSFAMIGNAAYLVAMILVGYVVAFRRIGRLLRV